MDELSSKYLSSFLKIIAKGSVSNTFIIIVSGYFFLTSIFSKKSTSFKGSRISSFLRKKIFSPIMIGGGIKKFEDAKLCFENGADKIFINSEFVNIELINKISDTYGNQSISIVLDYRKINEDYLVYTNYGSKKNNLNLKENFLNLQNKNIGEIILHSIDQDGTGNGFDLNMVKSLKLSPKKPLLLMGGAGKPINIEEALNEKLISGVITANLFNFIGNTLKVTRELCKSSKIQIANLF